MATGIKFEGGRELERALLELSTKSALKVGRFALRRAANEVLKAARANVPVDEGRLRRALRLRIDRGRYDKALLSALVYVSASAFGPRPRKTNRNSTVKGKFGPPRYSYQIGSYPQVYGAFVEFGAPGHGLPARPWFRPAWDSAGKQYAIQRIAEELANGLEREAARLARTI
ncbi:HK97-gp10 family putative phage morphogenesis protein [Novosphingobium sp.]|uniref:HK97-gp10 family putative phage morphogenesis protein n=1 Tax=Novosphingobium sp. TaxID=1874826 RepID=UPI0038BD973D